MMVRLYTHMDISSAGPIAFVAFFYFRSRMGVLVLSR